MIKKLAQEIKIFFASMKASLEESYISIFKGSVILLSISLAGLIQLYPHITKFDYDARKIQFEVEALAGKDIDKIDCDYMESKKAECTLAQYQLSSNRSAMSLASFIIVACGYAGFFLMYLSVQGYVGKALRQYREKLNN